MTGTNVMSNWVQHVKNSIDDFGESITLRTVSIAFDTTSYRDPTETTSDSTITAFPQILTTSDDLVKEGIFRAGDIIFWIKGDQTSVTTGNRIVFNSIVYEINDLISHKVGGTTYVIEVRTKKV